MARNDGKPENQHYVPKMLLRNFAFETKGKEEQVYVFDKHEVRVFPTAVSNIATERGFYDADYGGGSVSLERSLSILEEKTNAAFGKLIEHESLAVLSVEELAWVSIFVASQHIRVRHFREMTKTMNQALEDHIRSMGHEPSEIEGFPVLTDEEELKRFAIQFLVGSMKEFSALMADKAWVLMKTVPERPFWVSDNPVTMHNSEEFGPYGNIGLAVKGIQIHLPLTSTLTLALWCPSIVEDVVSTYEKGQRQRQNYLAQKTLGVNVDVQAIDRAIRLHDEFLEDKKSLILGLENGTPTACSPDNVTFLNSLQVKWSCRFVMAPNRDFELAERMLNEHPEYRNGIQPKVG